jgi:hypothetical protein
MEGGNDPDDGERRDATGDEDTEETTPQSEPYPTPLVSAAHIDPSGFATRTISEGRAEALELVAEAMADTCERYTRERCHVGLLGEEAVAQYLGTRDEVNTEIYADGGDGGVDLRFNGATVDVKTVGRQRSNPALTVDVYRPLTADYYALASRIGPRTIRLIGCAPRQFVANAITKEYDGDMYHYVEWEYLLPFVECSWINRDNQ